MVTFGDVKIFILCFQKTPMQPIGFSVRRSVSSKEHPVLVLDEELASTVRLATQLTQTSINIHVIVTILIQPSCHSFQVLRLTSNVGTDESCSRMTCVNIFSLSKDFFQGRIIRVEEPIGMELQFLVAFIEFVQGSEKGGGIPNVNFDLNFQLSALGPDRINTNVIDWNYLSAFVFNG